MNLSKLQETVDDRGTWSTGSQRVGHDLATEQLNMLVGSNRVGQERWWGASLVDQW